MSRSSQNEVVAWSVNLKHQSVANTLNNLQLERRTDCKIAYITTLELYIMITGLTTECLTISVVLSNNEILI